MLLPLVQLLILTSCKPIPLAYAKGILNAHTSHLTHLTPLTPLTLNTSHTFSDSALKRVFFWFSIYI